MGRRRKETTEVFGEPENRSGGDSKTDKGIRGILKNGTEEQTRSFKWDDWQLDFLRTTGDKILCCGRQVGKSEICAEDASSFAVNNPKSPPIVMVAPTERQAYALFTKTLNNLIRNYPKEVIIHGKDRPTKKRIKLRSGVEIYCLPVGKDGLGIRFLTIGRLYVDEASRIPELVWEAIEPALLTTGGDEILLSTPFGAIGTFYDIWINKDKAYDSFTRFSVTSEKVIEERPISESWTEKQREKALNKLKQAKSRWTQRRYAQEFLGEFVQDLFRWFSDDLIYKCCTKKRPDAVFPENYYYLGVDIARMGEDEGTFEILTKTMDGRIEQVENIVTKKKLTTETEDKILELDKVYNFKTIGIDAGAGTLGVSVFDHLIKKLGKRLIALNNAERKLDKYGRETAKMKKVDFYENLRSMMEHGEINLLDDDNIIESFSSVQYEYIQKDGEPTKLRIYGNYTHIVEGLIRAAWIANQKSINTQLYWI